MLGERFEISDGVNLIIRDDNVAVINIKNNIDSLTLKNAIAKYSVEIVTISTDVNDDTFDGLIEIKKLSILNYSKFSNTGLYKLKKLRYLYIDFPTDTQIDFGNLIDLVELKICDGKNITGLDKLENLRYFKLYKVTRKDLEIGLPPNIEMLEIIEGKLETLRGLEKIQNLRGLMVAYQNKLTDFSAISGMNEIWFLHFMNCKNLIQLAFLTEMKKLRQVNFENCKSIESLSPLKLIDSLKAIRITGTTKILDGDKSLAKVIDEKSFYSYPYQWK